MITISEREISEAMFGMDFDAGVCIECGNRQGGCEPDAENYECEACGEFKVFGLEQALLCGHVTIGG